MQFQKKAQQLIYNNAVTKIEYIPNSQEVIAGIFDQYHFYVVKGHRYNKKYFSCQCKDFQFHHNCAHIEAIKIVLNKIENDNLHLDYADIQYINQLEKLLKEDILGNSTTDLNIEVYITLEIENDFSDYYPTVYIKAGFQKLFIIQKPMDFICSYTNNISYQLGKNDSINWNNIVLTTQQQKLLRLLEENSEFDVPYHYKSSSKFIAIHSLLIRKLLKMANECNWITINVQTQLQHYTVQLAQNELPLHIQIGKSNEQLLVKIDEALDTIYFKTLKVLIVNTKLYILTEKQHKIYVQLTSFFDSYGQIKVTKENWYKFLSYALVLWKQIATISVDRIVLDNIQNKVDPILLLHQDKNNIVATVENSNNGLLNIEKYIKLQHQLTTYGFIQKDNYYTLNSDDTKQLQHFLVSGIKQIEKIVSIKYEKTFGIFELEDDPIILTNQTQSLLDISFNINGISQKDIEHILNSINIKEPLYQLENGMYVNLEDKSFKPIHAVLSAIRGQSKIVKNAIQVDKVQAIAISQQTKSVQFNDNINKMINHLKLPENFYANFPKSIHTTLKDYQLLGFKWLKMLSFHQLGGILADEMGLGKTIQTMAYIISEIEENNSKPIKFLIISPASLVYNWIYEWERFAPHILVKAVLGDKRTRQSILNHDNVQVFITSYQSYRQDDVQYHAKEWHTIILDESQYIKNYSSKIHQSLRALNGRVIFALSGTPIENKVEDLWSVFAIILPGLFPNIKQFKQLSQKAISKMARPFILRRLKKDVLVELPEKIEILQYSELTKAQKTLYVGYLQHIQDNISQLSDSQMTKNRIQILAGITRLRQICNHPKLFIENYTDDSGKLEQCIELVQRSLENKQRVLLFSQFTSMLTILNEELSKCNISTAILTGQTPTKQRLDIVNAFNNGTKDVFLISLKAGGTGLNLTSANTIILYDLWWNPAIEEQATARAHRIGQKNNVHVYRLVSKGTIEEKILLLQEKKKELFDEMIFNENTNSINRTQLTNDDIREILGIK